MFCSKCGKSLPLEGSACPSCGHPIGESRFAGSAYTSAQAHIRPGDDVQQAFTQSYTRTTYTSGGDEGARGDVDTRTTYRPAYSEDSMYGEARPALEDASEEAPEEETVREEAVYEEDVYDDAAAYDDADRYDGLSDEARSTLEAVEEELQMESLDRSKYEWQSIESTGQAGIHPDVSEVMESIERGNRRRSMRSRRRAAYDDYSAEASADYVAEEAGAEQEPEQEASAEQQPAAEPVQAEEAAQAEEFVRETETVADGEAAEEAAYDPGFDDGGAVDYDDSADYDDAEEDVFEDIDAEEFDEMRHSSFSLTKLLKVLAILIVASGVIVGGLMWVRHIQGSTSSAPIENVREDFYNSGIALMKEHVVADQYNDLIASAAMGDMAGLAVELQTSTAAVAALLPADATENEKLFLSALKKIETNIGNCITSDALNAAAIAANDATAVAQSEERWTVVQNSVTMLEAAKSAMELTAIVNGEVVDVLQPTPEPTPEPKANYNTLSKGDKSDEVFNMQNRLYELGFLNDDRDGAFGAKTQTAVKMFQQIAGLPTTGIADSATLEALYAEDAPRTPYAQPSAQ